MPEPKRIYCDTCVLLAWITNEKRQQDQMDALYEAVAEVDGGRAIWFISDELLRGEILEASTGQVGMSRLHALTKSRKLQPLPFHPEIPALTAEIRNYYAEMGKIDGLGGLSFPDAKHVATAIQFRIPVMYSWDGSTRKSGKRNLISISGNVAGKYGLIICPPPLKDPYLPNIFPA